MLYLLIAGFFLPPVAVILMTALPGLSAFETLSPIPGLNKWLGGTDIDAQKTAGNQALAAHELLEAKRSNGMPFDPVAWFHLENGAMIHVVHADADTLPNGRKQSNGTMASYVYDLSQISQNHEQFLGVRTLVASAAVKTLSGSVASKI